MCCFVGHRAAARAAHATRNHMALTSLPAHVHMTARADPPCDTCCAVLVPAARTRGQRPGGAARRPARRSTRRRTPAPCATERGRRCTRAAAPSAARAASAASLTGDVTCPVDLCVEWPRRQRSRLWCSLAAGLDAERPPSLYTGRAAAADTGRARGAVKRSAAPDLWLCAHAGGARRGVSMGCEA